MSKALTAAAVEKLKPNPEKRIEVPDGLLPGLYLVIQPSGRKSWATRYRSAGKPRKLTLGSYPALQLDEARDAARQALRDAQAGTDPAEQKKAAKVAAKDGAAAERDSFDAVARLFIARYAKPKNRGWKEQARLLGLIPDPAWPAEAENVAAFLRHPNGAAAAWGDRRIQSVTKRDIVEFLDGVVDRGSPIAANRILAVLRRLFGWAVDRDILPASPAAGVKAPTAEESRDRVLSDAELRAVWKAADAIGQPFGPMVKLLILTAQRRDEVAAMTWREVDRHAALWTLPRSRAKNGQEHSVPLSNAAVAVLEACPEIAGAARYVFTTTGETPVSGFSRAKSRLDREALAILKMDVEERGEDPATVTLPDWRLHDLRRTAATGMARLGIDLPVIEKVLNHVSGSFAGIVGVYQRHSYEDEKKRALEAWGSFVTALVTDRPKDNILPMRRAAE
jgi:integrase